MKPSIFVFSFSVVSALSFGCSSSEGTSPASPSAGGSASVAGTSAGGASGAVSSLGGAQELGGSASGVSSDGGDAGSNNDAGRGGSAGGSTTAGGSASAGGSAGSAGTGGSGGGKVLMIAGAMPLVGVDQQIHEVLAARHLDVQDIRENVVSPADAQDKQLIIVSYSILSTDFKAADFADVAVPLIVLEHTLLPPLGMTGADGHGYQDTVTQITLTKDSPLNGGMPLGDVTIYSRVGEVFWGVPSANAITVATVKGDPSRAVTFGYPAGAMMVGRVAPAKRLQLFVAVHAPPPNPDAFLSGDGLKLVDAAVSWSMN
jgi:hypothetical protein